MGVPQVYEVVMKSISLLFSYILSNTIKIVCKGAYWK